MQYREQFAAVVQSVGKKVADATGIETYVNPVQAELIVDRYWEDAYTQLCELVLDEYSADEADYLLERITLQDIAAMAIGIAFNERYEGVYDVVAQKLLKRYDVKLRRFYEEEVEPYLERWYGTAPEDYQSDAQW